jgi:hypothetical protein
MYRKTPGQFFLNLKKKEKSMKNPLILCLVGLLSLGRCRVVACPEDGRN